MSSAARSRTSVSVAPQSWWIGYWRNGEPFYESSKSERKEDALRLLKLRQGEIVTGRFAVLASERVTIAELLELVIADYADNDRRSIDDLKLRIEKQVRAYFGDLRSVDLTTGHALKFIQKRKSDHIGNRDNQPRTSHLAPCT